MDQESSLNPGHNGEPIALIGQVPQMLQHVVIRPILYIRNRVAKAFVVLSVFFLLLWISAFLYGSLYYSYMPNAAFSTAVHYYYRTDCESLASFMCPYPMANVSLMRNKKHVLTFGQAYKISLQLEMPDSPINQALGMFMIKTTFLSQNGGQVTSSAQPARQDLSASSSRFSMLRYRTDQQRLLETLLFLQAFLSRASEQKQMLDVELFSDYTDDPYSPSATVLIEILSKKVQIYSSQLHIHAHFTGIRYLLFNFPLISAFVAVSTNFIFLSAIFIYSYMRVLLTENWAPEQLQSEQMLSHRENMNNSRLEDEGEEAAGLAEVLDSLQVTSMHPGKDFHFDINTEGHIRQRQAQSEINELEAARGHDNRERERNEGTG